MSDIKVKLIKTKSRFILTEYGAELVYLTPSFGKRLEWKSFKAAEKFLMEKSFVYNGEVLNPDNIEITEMVDSYETDELKRRLEEAEKVIKFYANTDQLTEEEKQMTAGKYHLVYGLKANDYLNKHGGDKWQILVN